jgi:hypothetical protein
MWHGPSAEQSKAKTLLLPACHHQIRGKSSNSDVTTSEFLYRISNSADVMAIPLPSIQHGLTNIFKMGRWVYQEKTKAKM